MDTSPKVPINLDNWYKELESYLSAADINDIKNAYQLAVEAHGSQKRASGEPYITHCITVAQTLADMKMEGEVLVAALLHDVPEDTDVTLEEIRLQFGDTVAKLVDGVTKLKQATEQKSEPAPASRKKLQQTENLRKMFLAIGEDVRVVLIKLADRQHNIRTLGSLPDHKRKRIARETLEIFAPLANRLGMQQFKSELEDNSFKYLYPEQYNHIARQRAIRQAYTERHITRIANELQKALDDANIKATLSWRTKHLYSIYQKMQRKEVDISQIYDVMALRVLVDTEQDCYAALGVIHTQWRPIPREFDDYIAAPKENGYQSLHTAVIDKTGQQFEVQIRTEDMHRQAELGIAAHWRYKSSGKLDAALNQKIIAMRNAIKMQIEEDASSEEFVNAVKSDVIEEKVYVFTPKGDVFELALGSTPIDLAYHIHTDIGHKCRGAKVNGSLVGLSYQLKHGDKVEILLAKRGGPSRDWLNENLGYVKTTRARKKIRYWFKKQNYQESVTQGRHIFEREIRRLHITDVKYEEVAEACKFNKSDDMFAALGFGDISLQHIIKQTLDLSNKKELPPDAIPLTALRKPSAVPTDTVTVLGMGNLLTSIAKCCHPVPGDPIVGYITRGRGVSVHRKDCGNIIRTPNTDRLIQVSWGSKDALQTYPVNILVQGFNRVGLMADISEVIANEKISITDIAINNENLNANVFVALEVSDLRQLKRIMDKIEQLPNVTEVNRKR